MCGGPQDSVVKMEATGVWGHEDGRLKMTHQQINVLRCVDCEYDEEVGNGEEKIQKDPDQKDSE